MKRRGMLGALVALVAAPAVLMAGDWKPWKSSWKPWRARGSGWRYLRRNGKYWRQPYPSGPGWPQTQWERCPRETERRLFGEYYRGRQWDPPIVVKPPVTLPPNYKSPARLYLESILRRWERR